MNELAASHLEIRKTEAKKSSMMNKMGQETEKFFLILSAKHWDEKRPGLNEFMKRLMKDKGTIGNEARRRRDNRKWAHPIS
jgi:hypothetical protein